MINEIISGIVTALAGAFPEAEIYKEEVTQGLTEPCFIVRLLNPANTQFLGNRYHRMHLFSVQYIPAGEANANAECYGVIDTLFQALEYITVSGDLVRGTKMNSEHFDGVLTFFVNYDIFVKFEEEKTLMEDLTIKNIEVMGELQYGK